MNNDFYRVFEEKFRGSRELIKTRLKIYLPFIEPLKEIYPDATGIDLGCGRGEWLELLGEHGFSVQGVDLDEQMLAASRELGLNVRFGDALACLKELDDESQVIVSSFHMVEHVSFKVLQELIGESLRVLKPAGLLILETPNPENISVSTVNFYIDPTHLKPIPSQLLAFLPEYFGFGRIKILRLQESELLTRSRPVNLIEIFNNVSPDYVVVAQKPAEDKWLDLTEKAFALEYGITLECLVNRYEQQMKVELEFLNKELQAIHSSKSWQITRPLRDFKQLVKRCSGRLHKISLLQKQGLLKHPVSWLITELKTLKLKYPKLVKWAKTQVYKCPKLEKKLRQAAQTLDLKIVQSSNKLRTSQSVPELATDISQLTPYARDILTELKNSIKKYRQGSN